MLKRQMLAALMFGVAVASTTMPSPIWAKSKTPKALATEVPDLSLALAFPSVPGVSLRNYSLTLKQLGVQDSFQLRGIDPIYSVPFGIPANEVVTAIKLKLDFSYSPSLLTNLSHLKILLNGEVAQTIPLPKEQAGARLVREISIDPRLVTDFNRLDLQFIGHYTLDCEDPFHSSLWLNVSNLSSVQFTVTPLSVTNDLAFLPVPFFDRRDGRRLERPFVFGASPSAPTLESAGIVASWFGDLASYRGAWFPAHLNKLPTDNVVVFATNEDRPQGLLDIPTINGPTVAVAPHPADNRFKILYVLGRDAAELRTAAVSLGLGKPAMAGQSVGNAQLSKVKPRVPYDAPRWLPSDRPVKFGEIATVDDLNVRGLAPDLVRLNMITPPDLFGWRSKGIPVDLKYRYTPRPRADKSNLNILTNGKFVNSYPLLAYAGAQVPDSRLQDLVNRVVPGELLPASSSFNIPFYQLGARSQVQFQFSFDYPKEGACRDVVLDNTRAAIDPESQIDISQFSHYLKMPDMGAFANTGFPFTRMADLSETAVILPDEYRAGDIGTYLTMMGRMGESTGLPVYGVSVARAVDVKNYANKDLMLIGGTTNQPLLKEWAGSMPFSVDGVSRLFSLSDVKRKLMPWYETQLSDEMPVAQLTANTLATDAVLFGFESPLKSGRSVVALTSDRASGQADVLSALMDAEVVPKIQGGVAVIRGKDVETLASPESYYVGSLPPYLAVRWALSSRPWLVALMIFAVAVAIAGVVYTLLRRQASQRLTGK